MSNTKKKKKMNKSKRIKELKEELSTNDELYKKNKEKRKMQVQIGLYKKGYPQGSPMYDQLLEKMESDKKEIGIIIESKYAIIHPVFKYQLDEEWQKLKTKSAEKEREAVINNLEEIKKKVKEVEQEIDEQNTRLENRREQLLDELKTLKADLSELKKPHYIG